MTHAESINLAMKCIQTGAKLERDCNALDAHADRMLSAEPPGQRKIIAEAAMALEFEASHRMAVEPSPSRAAYLRALASDLRGINREAGR